MRQVAFGNILAPGEAVLLACALLTSSCASPNSSSACLEVCVCLACQILRYMSFLLYADTKMPCFCSSSSAVPKVLQQCMSYAE